MICSAWTIKDGAIIRYQRTILNEARRSIDKYPVTNNSAKKPLL